MERIFIKGRFISGQKEGGSLFSTLSIGVRALFCGLLGNKGSTDNEEEVDKYCEI